VNGRLPMDLSVAGALEVGNDFHARFSAKRRSYVYFLWRGAERSALYGRYAWHKTGELDLIEMRKASRALVGSRDFAAFANAGGDPGSTTVRDLKRLDVASIKSGKFVVIRVTANAFLRSMVRNLVGCLVCVGRNEIAADDCSTILASCNRESNPCRTAPASGLCLWRVDY
jgi:tRNA pseudouridine38-40 synthase